LFGMGSQALFLVLATAMIGFGMANALALRGGAWSGKKGT